MLWHLRSRIGWLSHCSGAHGVQRTLFCSCQKPMSMPSSIACVCTGPSLRVLPGVVTGEVLVKVVVTPVNGAPVEAELVVPYNSLPQGRLTVVKTVSGTYVACRSDLQEPSPLPLGQTTVWPSSTRCRLRDSWGLGFCSRLFLGWDSRAVHGEFLSVFPNQGRPKITGRIRRPDGG